MAGVPGRLAAAGRGAGRPLVVGYMGTYTHDDDLAMIAPALRALHERLGDGVRFEFVGAVSRAETFELLGGLPFRVVRPTPEEATYPEFVPWFLRTFRWDIGLAPLRLTPFTRGKSDIKFLDYAAAGAAGVYSRHPAYLGTVRHGETGWLVSDDPAEWADALATLAGDADLRGRLACAAREYLFEARTLARTAHLWPEALRRLAGGEGESIGADQAAP